MSPQDESLIRSLPQKGIKELFENLRQEEYRKLTTDLSPTDLTQTHARIKLFSELETRFLSVFTKTSSKPK